MRIAMVAACPFPSPQGSQVFVREMAEALGRRGHRVELLTYGQSCGIGRDSSRHFVHRRIGRVPGDDASRSGPTLAKPLLDLRLALALRRVLAAGGFDVVHCHNYEAAAIGAAVRAWSGVPTVYHSHGTLGAELPTYFHGRIGRSLAGVIGRSFDRCVPRGVDHTLVLSETDAERLRQLGVDSTRISVIAPAVAPRGPVEDAEIARRKLGLPLDRFVVGYAGNLDAYQSLDVLAAAVARLAAERSAKPPLWLVATHASDDRFRAMLVAHGVREHTRVLECDSFETAARAMAASDMLVSPRQVASGCPIKLLNYMAAGRAIVTGEAGFGLLRDGEDGVVIRGGGAERWASALGRVADDPVLRTRLGQAAKRRVAEELRWEVAVPAIERAYAEAVGARNAARAGRLVLR